MIRIYKDNDTKVVTKGAYEQFYKSLGYNVVLDTIDVVEETVETEVQDKVVEEVKETKNVEKIEDAKILVSCGRGVKDVAPAFDVAKKVKGTVSSSRSLVDSGIIEHARQVGQTGKTVRPEAYLAFGISGAVQHLAGMEDSELIIAVNKDETASIFNVADVGIVSDATRVLPLLKEEIEKIIKA